MQKFNNYICLALLALLITIIICISQGKQSAVYSQLETNCMCAPSAYIDESKLLCVTGNLFCSNIADTVCGCDGKDYLNSCTAHANGVKTFTKDSCSLMSLLACMSDEQCPQGKCVDGNSFKKFKCDLSLCTLVSYSAEPCSSSSSGNCQCTSGSYFDGGSCVKGTLNCSNLLPDSVCGCDNNTYLNSCVARANGIKSFTKGECSTSSTALSCSNDDQCPSGKCPDNKAYKNFSCVSNKCKRITFTTDPCSSADCKCLTGEFFDGKNCILGKLNCLSSINDPVCGCDGITYSNSCTARTSGIKQFTKGECNPITAVLNCNIDSDCPLGICKSGETYKRFSCNSNNQCQEVAFLVNPCGIEGISTSSSSSGSIVSNSVDKNFTGFWQTRTIKCLPKLESSSSSSSGSCITCPNVSVLCPKGSILVPQGCNTCPYCESCKGVTVAFQLCAKNGQLKGIINHNRYLDRAIIETKIVDTPRKILASTVSKTLGTDVEVKLKLIDKEHLIANFDNDLYKEKLIATKIQSKGCPVAELMSDCCEGYIAPSSAKQCTPNFSLSQCLATDLNSNVCCPTSLSCAVPCGSSCCRLNEDCVLLDPCSNKNPFCFVNPALACIDCNPKSSCSLDEKSCPAGTVCSGKPDFLCYTIGCPQLK